MPQISLEINQAVFDKIKKMAQIKNTTVSYLVEDNINHFIEEDYPEDFFELFGAIKDETFVLPDRMKSQYDLPREEI